MLGDQQESEYAERISGLKFITYCEIEFYVGEIPGGSRLIQGPLSEAIGTSQIPVRDALKRLESDGLVKCDETGRYCVVQFSTGRCGGGVCDPPSA